MTTSFDEVQGQFSPDGRWVAYASNESGLYEIYIRPFHGPGGKKQVSTGGGIYPRWRHDGHELFYVAPDKTVVDYGPGITSFLCTYVSRDLFEACAMSLDGMQLTHPDDRPPGTAAAALTNAACLQEARDFYKYADVEGYRGSPHKL